MKLNLKKPLVVFDLETTGVNITKDRIVELCYIIIHPNGTEDECNMRINPEMHIPEMASAVHGIYDEDVKDCPTFKQVAKELAAKFQGCDFAGFNSNHFDIPLLVEEFARAGVSFDISKIRMVDVQNIFHKMEKRTLIAAYRFYCDKDLENAHSAMADTRATYEVLQAQLDRYSDELQNDIDYLADFSKVNNNVDLAGRIIYDENKVEIFNFGKYKGEAVREVLKKDPGYFGWILQGDFAQNTKDVLIKIRLQESTMFNKN
ncbi:MAG: 3'-5' exonuclease [Prevotellaceae bacterium]|nr:3'-5' exonuclease [Candidatus Faecinaster equi]